MERRYFSRDIALIKLGARIRSQIGFTGVPIGTTGTVIEAYEVQCERYTLAIHWDLPGCGRTDLAWLSRNEYERFLVELPSTTH